MCYLKEWKPEERVDIDGTLIKWGEQVAIDNGLKIDLNLPMHK